MFIIGFFWGPDIFKLEDTVISDKKKRKTEGEKIVNFPNWRKRPIFLSFIPFLFILSFIPSFLSSDTDSDK